MNQRRFCRFLGVSRKSYYRVIQDEPSPDDEHEHEHELKPELRRNSDSDGDERQVLNEQERRRIQELAKEHELYGHRKICVLADREGIETSFSTVYRELKRVGLNLPRDYARQAKRRAKRKREKEEITEINQEWQTDLVEFKIGEFGTHYFIGVEDIFSRYVLAWILSPTQPAEVVVEVLERAWEKRSGLWWRRRTQETDRSAHGQRRTVSVEGVAELFRGP